MTDEELVAVIHGLGVEEDSCSTISLLPFFCVAWSVGGVPERDRTFIEHAAEQTGVVAGEGKRVLEDWLTMHPSPAFVARAQQALIELAERDQKQVITHRQDVVGLCEHVTAVAASLLGPLVSLSSEERDGLAEIAHALGIERWQDWKALLQLTPPRRMDEDPTDDAETNPAGELGAVDVRAATAPAAPVRVMTAPERKRDTGPTRRFGRHAGPGLHVLAGDGERRVWKLDKGPYVIGRAPECEFQIRWDHQVSRQHCRLIKREDTWAVVDCGSTNGTFVNEKRVLEQRLTGGEVIRIGDTRITYEGG